MGYIYVANVLKHLCCFSRLNGAEAGNCMMVLPVRFSALYCNGRFALTPSRGVFVLEDSNCMQHKRTASNGDELGSAKFLQH